MVTTATLQEWCVSEAFTASAGSPLGIDLYDIVTLKRKLWLIFGILVEVISTDLYLEGSVKAYIGRHGKATLTVSLIRVMHLSQGNIGRLSTPVPSYYSGVTYLWPDFAPTLLDVRRGGYYYKAYELKDSD